MNQIQITWWKLVNKENQIKIADVSLEAYILTEK